MKHALAVALLVAVVSPAFAADRAEYQRLSSDMENLAERHAWEGVERLYRACVETGAQMSFQDHLFGAHAATDRGDVKATRERLAAANDIREDRSVIEWLWAIDTGYVEVHITADEPVRMSRDTMPMHPQQAAAIRFAIADLAEDGEFDGYLPPGSYAVGPKALILRPGDEPVELQLEGPKRRSRFIGRIGG